jgi:hypothetical protein
MSKTPTIRELTHELFFDGKASDEQYWPYLSNKTQTELRDYLVERKPPSQPVRSMLENSRNSVMDRHESMALCMFLSNVGAWKVWGTSEAVENWLDGTTSEEERIRR